MLKSAKVERHKNSVVLSHKSLKVVGVMVLKMKTSTEEDMLCCCFIFSLFKSYLMRMVNY